MSVTRQLMDYIDFSIYLSVDSRTFNDQISYFELKKKVNFPFNRMRSNNNK